MKGFGFPPVEAMACGTATVVSNKGSLPEVVQDGGLVIEPNAESFAEAITKLIENSQLRKSIEKKGIEIAKQFTWEKAALETKAIYNKILS